MEGSQNKIQPPNTQEHNRPQHDRPVACVITQQYSSATFFSLCFHSSKEKSSVPFRNVIF